MDPWAELEVLRGSKAELEVRVQELSHGSNWSAAEGAGG